MESDQSLKKLVSVGDVFYNEQFGMRYKILDIDGGPNILCEYTRNGVTIQHPFVTQQLIPSLLNPELFQREQLNLFNQTN